MNSGAYIADGDLLGDESGPQCRVIKEPMTYVPTGTVMHNPYGVWRLIPLEAADEATR